MEADRCVMCGEIIPEGRQVCPACESKVKERRDYIRAIVTLRNGGCVTLYPLDYQDLGRMLDKLPWTKFETE